MKKPSISEADIRRYATEQSFYRGEEYYDTGAVGELVWRDGVLQAEVSGSHYEPYNVTATFTDEGIAHADCDCPYDWGGWCKHIVAVLLAYVRDPASVEERPPLQSLTSDLGRDQLEELLLDLAARDATLVDHVEALLAVKQPVEQPAAPPDKAKQSRALIDPKSIRRQVQSILHSLDRMRSSEAYWHVEGVVDGVRSLLISAWDFIADEDWESASALLEAITDEYIEGWVNLDDSDGFAGDFFTELGEAWTQACLVADLATQEREKWAEKLAEWQAEIGEYGVVEAFDAAQAAVLQGWDYPPLQRAMHGHITELGAWEENAPWFADELAIARLQVLERRQQYEEYLNLAQAEGQIGLYVVMLAKIGREEEAVEEGMRYLQQPQEVLSLARTLHERGRVEAALKMAEYGLTLDGAKRTLAEWLRIQAAAAGRLDLALDAAMVVFHEEQSLASYLAVHELSGEGWGKLREELLARLRNRSSVYGGGPTEIFLHENLLDDAIASVEKGGAGYDLLERVMDAVVDHRPDWVIQRAQDQAARIIEPGQAKYYHHAVGWLRKAQQAYRAAGREADWQAYLAELRERHGRKYKLMDMLEGL